MPVDIFRQIIDELVHENPDYVENQPVWLHHFGESLLHPEFSGCIRYAVGKGVVTCLSINPLMLSKNVATALLESKPDLLYISLDGHNNESFEKIRGVKNAYERSLKNLQGFLDMKNGLNSNCRTVLSMIDFDMNQDSIEQTRSYWEHRPGVDEFLMKQFCTWDGSAQDVNGLQDSNQTAVTKPSKHVECNFPWERMTVLWDGTVVPCCNDYDRKLSLGNIKEQSLSEIWNGPEMVALRKEFISNQVTNPLCRHCEKLRLPRDQWDW